MRFACALCSALRRASLLAYACALFARRCLLVSAHGHLIAWRIGAARSRYRLSAKNGRFSERACALSRSRHIASRWFQVQNRFARRALPLFRTRRASSAQHQHGCVAPA